MFSFDDIVMQSDDIIQMVDEISRERYGTLQLMYHQNIDVSRGIDNCANKAHAYTLKAQHFKL